MSGYEPGRRLRVVVADDDPFTNSLVGDGLRAQGFDVASATSAHAAWTAISIADTNALVTDLNFEQGESGARLLRRVDEKYPWIGLVVLTSHVSPSLAVADAGDIPERAVYLVKSHLRHVSDLADAVRQSISGDEGTERSTAPRVCVITRAQADVLRMLAAGDSTRAIAEHRETSIRAAETMIARLYLALGLGDDDDRSNLRVAAVRLWKNGGISVV